jgi:hypothetical protein
MYGIYATRGYPGAGGGGRGFRGSDLGGGGQGVGGGNRVVADVYHIPAGYSAICPGHSEKETADYLTGILLIC